MGALILSKRDLSDDLNRVQARYELNRAIDTNDTQALADWTKNWGESALGELRPTDEEADYYEMANAIQSNATNALASAEHLLAEAFKSDATVEGLKEPIQALFRKIDAIDDLLRGD